MSNEFDFTDDIQRHESALKEIAMRILRDSSAADDVIQEVWVVTRDHGQKKAGLRNTRAWLASVTRNVARNEARSRSARKVREEMSQEPERLDGDPAETAEKSEVSRALLSAIDAVGEPYGPTLTRHYLRGMSAREIARQDGSPLATVETRIRRGLDQLRAKLEPEFGGDRAFGLALFGAFDWSKDELRSLAGAAQPKMAPAASAFAVAGAAVVLLAVGAVGASLMWERPRPVTDAGPEVAGQDSVVRSTASDFEQPAGQAVAVRPGERMSVEAGIPSEAQSVTSAPPAAEEASAGASGKEPLRSVQVRVFDADGKPFEGARVIKYAWEDRVDAGRTDASGRVIVPVPSTDSGDPKRRFGGESMVELVAAAPGRARSVRVLVPVDALPEDTVHLWLRGPALDLAGRVVDQGGAPVESAEIHDAVGLGSEAARSAKSFGLTRDGRNAVTSFAPRRTGLDGSFRIEALPREARTILVSADGYGDVSIPIDPARDGLAPLVIEMEPEVLLTGIVLNAAGLPAAGASVKARYRTPKDLPDVSSQADQSGRFTLRRLRAGSAQVTASLGAESFKSEVVIKPGSDPLDIQLQSGWQLLLEVVDEAGEPQRDLGVVIRGLKGDDRSFVRKALVLDENGRLEVPGVPSAIELFIVSQAVAIPIKRQVLDPVPRERLRLVVDGGATETGTLEGVITRAGQTLPQDVAVEAWKLPDIVPIRTTFRGDGSSFSIAGAPEGRYEVVVHRRGHYIERVTHVDVPGGGGLIDLGRIDLAPHGRIELMRAPGLEVDLDLAQHYTFEGGRQGATRVALRPDEDQQTVDVAAGIYDLIVRSRDGETSAGRTFAVAPGHTMRVDASLDMSWIGLVEVVGSGGLREGELVEVYAGGSGADGAVLGTARTERASSGRVFVCVPSPAESAQLRLPDFPSVEPFEVGSDVLKSGAIATWSIGLGERR